MSVTRCWVGCACAPLAAAERPPRRRDKQTWEPSGPASKDCTSEVVRSLTEAPSMLSMQSCNMMLRLSSAGPPTAMPATSWEFPWTRTFSPTSAMSGSARISLSARRAEDMLALLPAVVRWEVIASSPAEVEARVCGPRGDAEIGAPRGVVRMDVVLLAAEGAVDDAALEMNRGDAKRLDDGESAPTLDSCGRLTAGACDSSQWWLTLLLMWLRREGVTKALSHIILGRGRQRLEKRFQK